MRVEELESDTEDNRTSHPVDGEERLNVAENMNELDEVDDEEEVPVTLGFAVNPENNWSLLRQMFPSKAGGVPAWLDPVNLPTGKSCLCDMCGEPLQFLIQVYCPISEKESTFHRTLFVFMCLSMTCLLRDQHEQWKRGSLKPSRSVKVFRCQLPRTNAFYSNQSPRRDGTDTPLSSGVSLCAWCGTWKGDKVCSSCKRARYCSEKHQAAHWVANHKLKCQQLIVSFKSSNDIDDASSNEILEAPSKTLWPEYEISSDDESEFLTSDTGKDSDSIVSRQQMDESVNSLMESFEGDDDRRSWATFQERLAEAQGQVLRYSRDGAKPLWPTSSGQPSRSDIPKCSTCGGARNFEFQIMPQLLYYFGVDNDVNSFDWTTIVVYTCSESCEGSPPYKEEFAWVQLNS